MQTAKGVQRRDDAEALPDGADALLLLLYPCAHNPPGSLQDGHDRRNVLRPCGPDSQHLRLLYVEGKYEVITDIGEAGVNGHLPLTGRIRPHIQEGGVLVTVRSEGATGRDSGSLAIDGKLDMFFFDFMGEIRCDLFKCITRVIMLMDGINSLNR